MTSRTIVTLSGSGRFAESIASIATSLRVLAKAKIFDMESAYTNGPTTARNCAELRYDLGLAPFESAPDEHR